MPQLLSSASIPFQLKSSFQLTGDQPKAVDILTQSIQKGNKHQTLLGVTGSGKTFTLAHVIQKLQIPTLIISHNKTLAAQLYQEFRDFFPDNAVSYFVSYYDYYQPEAYVPSTDTYIEKETDINDEIDRLRLSSTAHLLTRPDTIVVASVSCIYNLGSPVEYAKNFIELAQNQLIDVKTLSSRFIDMQYSRSDYELKRGTFRLKGDTLQIWPANLAYALSISLLDNAIETISPIDPLTFEVLKLKKPAQMTDLPYPQDQDYVPKRFYIYPAKHYQTNQEDQETIFKTIKTDLAYRIQELKDQGKIVEAYRLGQKVKYDLDMIKELGFVNGIENYSRYFDGRKPGEPPFSLLDYFHYNASTFSKAPESTPTPNPSFLTIIDESHITLPQLRGMYNGDQARKQILIDYGFRLPSAMDNRPLKFEEILERTPQLVYASATPNEWELGLSGNHVAEQLIRPTGLVDPEIEIRPSDNQIPNLIKEIMIRKSRGERVLVTTLTKRTAEALTEYLNDPQKIKAVASDSPTIRYSDPPKVQYLHADVTTLDRSDILDSLRTGEFDVVVGINLLREGLDLPEVSLVAIFEADKEGFLRSKTSLIQIMGRAARHQEGRVIMYADKMTPSMKGAIDEVTRRRTIQIKYNQKHRITPQSIQKPIREKLLQRTKEESLPNTRTPVPKSFKDHGWKKIADIDPQSLTPKDKTKLVKELKKLMNQAAKDWNFEQATIYRDTIKKLE